MHPLKGKKPLKIVLIAVAIVAGSYLVARLIVPHIRIVEGLSTEEDLEK